MSDPTDPAAGWYPDPQAIGLQRYWDGQAWTDHQASGDAVTAPQPLAADGPAPVTATRPLHRRWWVYAAGALALIVVIAVLRAAPSGTPSATPSVTPSATPSGTPSVTSSGSPSPSKPAGPVLVGSSFGGSGLRAIRATTALFPSSRVGRYYFPADPAPYGTSVLTAIPAGEVIFVSFKTAVATVASGAYDATFKTVLASWNASGRTIYWTWQHEADDPAKGINPADFVAGWNHLLSVAAAEPSPDVHSMTVLTAFALTAGQPHGNPESWYVPGVDVLGFDSYQLSTERLAEAYAASKGKRLAFPEFGDGTVAGRTDAQGLAFAQAFYAALTPDVFAAAWYNAGVNKLDVRPRTLAYLESLT